jgi:hypothetical protein
MSRSFLAHCLDCGVSRKVRRFELFHAALPRCLKCGGPIELSAAARENLAEIQTARRDKPAPDGRRKPVAEEPLRLVPRHEAGRYEFHEFQTSYLGVLRDPAKADLHDRLRAVGPVEFYAKLTRNTAEKYAAEQHDGIFTRLQINTIEGFYYECGASYYKVWPAICDALQHTEMRVDGEHFQLPQPVFELRLPKRDNSLSPLEACLFARLPGEGWTDGREWTCALLTVIPDRHGVQQYFAAMLPVRPGLLLEDALDQASLVDQAQGIDGGLVRRLLRVAVGVSFFGLDRHETILPDLPRRTIERIQRERRLLTARDVEKALAEARDVGLGGYKVGSEIDLPRPIPVGAESIPTGATHELTGGYVRRGHVRLQPVGKKRADRKLIFVAPHVVRPDLPLRSTHGYRIRVPKT